METAFSLDLDRENLILQNITRDSQEALEVSEVFPPMLHVISSINLILTPLVNEYASPLAHAQRFSNRGLNDMDFYEDREKLLKNPIIASIHRVLEKISALKVFPEGIDEAAKTYIENIQRLCRSR